MAVLRKSIEPQTFLSPPDQPQAAILLLTFNRSEPTCELLAWLLDATNRTIYLASDGPRPGNIRDTTEVSKIREFAASVSKDRIRTRFREQNLGCKKAVEDALDWFFSEEEFGIILEDDLVPHISFFSFCDYYLCSAHENERVWQICGYNPFSCQEQDFVAMLGQTWGWATWRDRWQHYRKNGSVRISFLRISRALGFVPAVHRYAELRWNALLAAAGIISSWAYPWATARLATNALTVLPPKNLVAVNTALEGTHTRSRSFEESPDVQEWKKPASNSLSYEPLFDTSRARLASPFRIKGRGLPM